MEADPKAQVTVSAVSSLAAASATWPRAPRPCRSPSFQERPQPQPPTGPTFCAGNLVSREHRVGVDPGHDKQFLLRAGRIDIPSGIRQDEHDLLVRNTATTRTNINESQQARRGLQAHRPRRSVARSWPSSATTRSTPTPSASARVLGFVELSLAQWAAVGAEQQGDVRAIVDYLDGTPHTFRQVHGVFARLAPVEPLVILAEADALIITSEAGRHLPPGVVDMVQADIEPTQGLHLIATRRAGRKNNYPRPCTLDAELRGAWLGALWFFAPHCDARFDFVASSVAGGPISFYLLPQLHAYL